MCIFLLRQAVLHPRTAAQPLRQEGGGEGEVCRRQCGVAYFSLGGSGCVGEAVGSCFAQLPALGMCFPDSNGLVLLFFSKGGVSFGACLLLTTCPCPFKERSLVVFRVSRAQPSSESSVAPLTKYHQGIWNLSHSSVHLCLHKFCFIFS